MATYQSRHQPRRQVVLTGKVNNTESYDRFYDIAYDALTQRRLPQLTLVAGQRLLRVVSGSLDIQRARCIAPGSSMNFGNRFSGPRLNGRPGQGALYVGTRAGVLREHAHYARLPPRGSPLQAGNPGTGLWRPGQHDATKNFIQQQKTGAAPPAGQQFHVYRLKQPMNFADLRVTALANLFMQLQVSGEGSRRYGLAGHAPFDLLAAAASDLFDYSASRGLADAVYDKRLESGQHGVCALSSRADTDSGLISSFHGDKTGGLVFAIFGADNQAVTELEPAAPPGKAHLATFNTFEAADAAML